MPFLNLDNNWSKLAPLYNQGFNNKPKIPPRIARYTSFDDGLVRGGVFNAALSTVKDVVRVGKFYISPRGVSFLLKQVGLQLTNPQLEKKADNPQRPTSGNGFIKNTLNKLSNFINDNQTRVYSLGLNTLAQVGVQAAGLHIVRHGLLPKFSSDYNYESIAIENNKLQGTKIGSIVSVNDTSSKNTNRLVSYTAKLNAKDSSGSIILQSYLGGAESVYGIGRTTIKTTSLRTNITTSDLGSSTTPRLIKSLINFGNTVYDVNPFRNVTSNTNPELIKKLNGFTPLTNEQIQNTSQADLNSSLGNVLVNSPKYYKGSLSDVYINALQASKNVETRVGTSNGKQIDSINSINITDSDTFYNTLKNKSANNVNSEVTTGGDSVYNDQAKVTNGTFGKDIINFRIEFLNNTNPVFKSATEGVGIIPNTDVLAFRAYIDNMDDGMQAKWNSYRYMGRGEEFYVYDGFTRDISVSFTVFAHTEEEMKPIYQKLNYLMSTFTPDYSNAGKMRGNIAYLTVGDYLSRTPGIFTDIKISGFLDTHWEINVDETAGVYQLPKLLKISLSFKPIHHKLPRKVDKSSPFSSNFILPTDNDWNTIDKVATPPPPPPKTPDPRLNINNYGIAGGNINSNFGV
jgi:hypothetical protein